MGFGGFRVLKKLWGGGKGFVQKDDERCQRPKHQQVDGLLLRLLLGKAWGYIGLMLG